jgi:hypothetical protein
MESPVEHRASTMVRTCEPHRKSHPVEKCLNH